MKKSIMQTEKKCFLTGSEFNLERHHIMNGPYRKKAEKYGLWIWLNHDVHMYLHDTREGTQKRLELKALAQAEFEKHWSRELWKKEFGKCYV